MALQGVSTWSTTAASNSTADPAVNWAEGQAPSSINDSARSLMASVAKWRDDISGSTSGLSTGGTSTAYTVTTNSTFDTAAAMSGVIFTIIPHTNSGAAPTLAVDGLTARNINQSTGVSVATAGLKSGTPYLLKYVHASTEFILVGRSDTFTNLTTTGTLTQSTTGQEILATGTTAQRPSNTAGGFRYNSDTTVPEYNTGSGWNSMSIPSGTLMLFQQTAAPSGWTKDTTHNDKALRVVSGTASSGGTSNFSTVFGLQATSGTTLNLTNLPSGLEAAGGASAGPSTTTPARFTLPNSSIGPTDQPHTHPIELRVKFVDLIIASKD